MAARRVLPELLDTLPACDPRAQRARRDLRRVNAWMGNARIVSRALQSIPLSTQPRRLVELGAGDGTFLLSVARFLPRTWQNVEVTLVDRQNLLAPETAAAFRALGWEVVVQQKDLAEWLRAPSQPEIVVVANLFLHHFEDAVLAGIFAELASRAAVVVACEPRRFAFPRLAGNLVWFIGCSPVTRHDAIASIAAGFVGEELSRLWPAGRLWRSRETEAGLFSHCFLAHRAELDLA